MKRSGKKRFKLSNVDKAMVSFTSSVGRVLDSGCGDDHIDECIYNMLEKCGSMMTDDGCDKIGISFSEKC